MYYTHMQLASYGSSTSWDSVPKTQKSVKGPLSMWVFTFIGAKHDGVSSIVRVQVDDKRHPGMMGVHIM